MPRTFNNITGAILGPQSADIILEALIISHADLAAPLRIVNNDEDITVSGITYTAVGFQINLPEQKEDGTYSQGSITLNNVTQWLTPTLRTISGEFTVTHQVLHASNLLLSPPAFDHIEMQTLPLYITSVNWNDSTAHITISHDRLLSRALVVERMTPQSCPALF